ncbi:hypothetical protein HDU82_008772 [Entophlyctis luteolus]|nr:hypothetical protein HDU82_008772 [Entophlyctis luteolus]
MVGVQQDARALEGNGIHRRRLQQKQKEKENGAERMKATDADADADADAVVDELQALAAIYGPAFSFDPFARRHRVAFSARAALELPLPLPAAYPRAEVPDYEIVLTRGVRWVSRNSKAELHALLLSMFVPGSVVLFAWIDELLSAETAGRFYTLDSPEPTPSSPSLSSSSLSVPAAPLPQDGATPVVHSGEILLDRKSRFQAHIARATTIADVSRVVAHVKGLPKVAQATHNMVAYRLANGHSDRDDDGEGGAGDRMLHLLARMNKVDVVAVVTRWYGGVQLGPDRFRDITGVLKKLIESTPEL